MHLIIGQTVDYLTTCVLQAMGHLDIVGFVKSCPKLHQHQHFLPIFRSFTKNIHNLAVAGYPVQGNLNGNHGWIPGRILQES